MHGLPNNWKLSKYTWVEVYKLTIIFAEANPQYKPQSMGNFNHYCQGFRQQQCENGYLLCHQHKHNISTI